MSRILCIGNLVLDQIRQLPQYPTEDSEQRVLNTWRQTGGNTANTALRLAAEGHTIELISTLADDSDADWLLQSLQAAKVSCRYCQRPTGSTPTSDIWLNAANGSRTIAHHRALPELSSNALQGAPLKAFDWIHLEGRNVDNIATMIQTIQTHKNYPDISLEVEKPRTGLEALLAQVKVGFISQQFAQAHGHSNAADCLHALGARYPKTLLTCTWGKQGAWLRDLHGQLHHQATDHTLTVRNTVGAGDNFNAGFIHGMSMQTPLIETLSTAVQFAQTHISKTSSG